MRRRTSVETEIPQWRKAEVNSPREIAPTGRRNGYICIYLSIYICIYLCKYANMRRSTSPETDIPQYRNAEDNSPSEMAPKHEGQCNTIISIYLCLYPSVCLSVYSYICIYICIYICAAVAKCRSKLVQRDSTWIKKRGQLISICIDR